MPRIKFHVAYDGRPYAGWQSQPNGNTVQDVLEEAFSGLFGRLTRIHGSGRTDAGVHALGQVFHIDAPDDHRMPLSKWPTVMNNRLPGSIRIMSAEYVPADFHSRFSAQGKTYRYRISRAPILSPFDAGRAWHLPLEWSIEKLREAVALFCGQHDFSAFAALRGNEPTPIPPGYFVRRITAAEVAEDGECVHITFTGNGFLYKMVRLMVGAAHDAARGKLPMPELRRLITAPRPTDKSPRCAPPDGLTLMMVKYN